MSVQGASPEPSSLNGDSPPVSIAEGQPLDFLDLEFWPAETDFRLDQMASTMEWLGQLDAQAGGHPQAGHPAGAHVDDISAAAIANGAAAAAEGSRQQQDFATLHDAQPDMAGVRACCDFL
jgi:hypothetical protein